MALMGEIGHSVGSHQQGSPETCNHRVPLLHFSWLGGVLCKERCQKPSVSNTLALLCLKTPENQSMLRKKHLQCSRKQPDEEQQQGGRKPAGFSSLAWVSLSLVPCCRQGPCRDRELRAAVGAAVPRAGTARDAHGCTRRRGKTASTASRRDLPHLRTVARAVLNECFIPGRALHSPAHHTSQLWRAGHGERAGSEAGDCLGCGTGAKAGRNWGSLGICPAQQQLGVYLCGSALTRPQRGVWVQTPPVPSQVQRKQQQRGVADVSTGIRAEAAAVLHPLLTRTARALTWPSN